MSMGMNGPAETSRDLPQSHRQQECLLSAVATVGGLLQSRGEPMVNFTGCEFRLSHFQECPEAALPAEHLHTRLQGCPQPASTAGSPKAQLVAAV